MDTPPATHDFDRLTRDELEVLNHLIERAAIHPVEIPGMTGLTLRCEREHMAAALRRMAERVLTEVQEMAPTP